MRVKQLLLQALSRANHIEDGTPADARELNKARDHLNSALVTYSDANLITAFQKVVQVTGAEEMVIGKYDMKRGKVMHEGRTVDDLPDPSRMTVGKDFCHVTSTDEYGRLIYEVEADVKYEKSTVPPTEPTTEPSTEPTTAVTTVPPTTPPGNNIPQTGTMLWLVPVLLIAGAVLVAAGIIIKKKISK